MKKFLFLSLFIVSFAFGADDKQLESFSVLAAGIGLGLAALGGAIGMGHTTAATTLGIARNPGLSSKLTTGMFIAVAFIEAQVIYALIIAIIVLYANPYIG